MTNKTIKGMKAPELKKLFEETVNDITKIKDALSNIEEQKQVALNIKNEIIGNEQKKGIIGEIKEIQSEADKKIKLIQDAHAELFGDDEDENDTGLKGELENLQKEFQATQEKIKSAEIELYGYEEKNENGEDKHIEGLTEKIKLFFETQKKRYTETYNKIENELLAGATTVGLSQAYEIKASSYKKPNRFWLIGFFLSIGTTVLILFFSLRDINSYFLGEKMNTLSTLSEGKLLIYIIVKLIIRVGIVSSLIWVTCFTSKNYSQNRRLSEEYSYKATFAKSFEGYRKRANELDQLGENLGLSEKLMLNMIEMSAFNPVKTMESESHKENHPTIELLEKSVGALGKSIDIIDKLKT